MIESNITLMGRDIYALMICNACNYEKMRISVHPDGIEMICAKCDRLVFYLHLPPEVTQQMLHPLDPKHRIDRNDK
jgi:hypothetical protein